MSAFRDGSTEITLHVEVESLPLTIDAADYVDCLDPHGSFDVAEVARAHALAQGLKATLSRSQAVSQSVNLSLNPVRFLPKLLQSPLGPACVALDLGQPPFRSLVLALVQVAELLVALLGLVQQPHTRRRTASRCRLSGTPRSSCGTLPF